MENYPQSEKLARLGDSQTAILEFLDWLASESLFICDAEGYGIPESYELLVLRYFDVDAKELDKERRAMLEELRRKKNAS